MKKLVFISLLLTITNVNAGKHDYQCTALKAVGVNQKGEVVDRKEMLIQKNTFVVDRQSGRIVGAPFGNANTAAENIKILEDGKSKNSFKVITTYKPSSLIDYLEIREFEDKEEKSFYGISFSTYVTGICR